MTHYPPLTGTDENMANILRRCLQDPDLPPALRDPANWPAQLRAEYGDDGGAAAAERHRATMVGHFRRARQVLDDFRPDALIIWGDDQYENFKEDIIPPFCVFAYDEVEAHPWAHERAAPNVWGEDAETAFSYKGHPQAAKYLAARLLEQDIDMPYAYQPLHYPGLAHAFLNTLLFLDYDRKGLPYPVIAFQVNCYGRRVIYQRGGGGRLGSHPTEGELDPPSPAPRRCMQVGAAVARVMAESPWRVALVASSSWSHAFLTRKNYHLYPDVEADRRLYEALKAGEYDTWRRTSLDAIEESGQQELLNWFMLAGAMEELGRKPDECDFVEAWAFNSNKCFAVFKP
jgi:hypothetical protein